MFFNTYLALHPVFSGIPTALIVLDADLTSEGADYHSGGSLL